MQHYSQLHELRTVDGKLLVELVGLLVVAQQQVLVEPVGNEEENTQQNIEHGQPEVVHEAYNNGNIGLSKLLTSLDLRSCVEVIEIFLLELSCDRNNIIFVFGNVVIL